MPIGTTVAWTALTQPYIKSAQVFSCPSNSSTTKMDGTDLNSDGTNDIFVHYEASGGYKPIDSSTPAAFRFTRPMDFPDGSSLAEVQSAAQTLIVLEYNGTRKQGNVYSESVGGGISFTNHLGTTNWLFVDGHVKAMRPSQTVSGGVNMWANDTTVPVPTALTNSMNYWEGQLLK